MADSRASIPKGTRDFGPAEMVKRNYIFDTIKDVFRNYGFSPIETPAMENLDTLLGKYGEEGDKLLFRILNSGDYLKKADAENIDSRNSLALSSQICDRGLRYDLTVPFARFVVQHRNELTFPFRRYQVQPVWRADRPQKGRYREFYQCDVDVIGSDSLLNEAELLAIVDDVFSALGINVIIKLNNRKILAGMAELMNAGENLTDLTVAIDKIEKIGFAKVKEELMSKGFRETDIAGIEPVLSLSGTFEEKIVFLESFFSESETALKGISEMKTLKQYSDSMAVKCEIELDLSLARGLNYYTGAIIEVKAKDVQIGSICGGGRYDDLTGIFGLPGVSGVGISFGADRIYDVLEQSAGFPEGAERSVQLMFVNFGEKEVIHILQLVQELRSAGISTEIYPDQVKIKKQMTYADRNRVPFICMAGEEEITNNKIVLKHMESGEQYSLDCSEGTSGIPALIKAKIEELS